METSRGSLGLAVGLFAASLVAVMILVPWLSARAAQKKVAEEEIEGTIPEKVLIRYKGSRP